MAVSPRRQLAESPRLLLVHEYETAMVVDRATGAETVIWDRFYGDPCCGVIAPDDSWVVVAGRGLVLFAFDRGPTEYMGDTDIVAMRLESPALVRFVVDPWSDKNATWTFAPLTGELRKLHDGPDLRDQPWTEDIQF